LTNFDNAKSENRNDFMTTFERRKQLLSLLGDHPGIKVTELASRLDVSQGTIRNDLRALEKAGELTRVRGGAVLRESHQYTSPSFAARANQNTQAKDWIARRAADTIREGDSILLDASSTVFSMAPYLQELDRLTIITNGIEIALALARNPSHNVLLLGGMIHPEGTSVVGHLGEKILADLHIKTAYVSCSGFSVQAGLTEVDIQEVQIKQHMIRSAERVVALVDSSKFGRVDLTSFARTTDISQIFTDHHIESSYIEELRQTCTALTVCGQNTVSTFAPCQEEDQHYAIGFANQSEQLPFAIDVRRGLERAAKDAGNIDLILADNQLDGEIALQVADRLIAEEVDLVIEYQVDEKVGSLLMDKLHRAGIPVIAVDIPIVGATFFGVDNYRAGHMAGVALGNWIADQWKGHFDHLLILEEPRVGALPASRLLGQLDGLQEVLGEIAPSRRIYLDSGNTSEQSRSKTIGALEALPDEHRIAVITINDDAAVGALTAARELGRETDIVIVGQGADRVARSEIRHPDSRLIGSTAYWPERYGEKLIPLAIKLVQGEAVPPAEHIDHEFIDADNIGRFYPE
jgi:ribose transport system substrate-binding protein